MIRRWDGGWAPQHQITSSKNSGVSNIQWAREEEAAALFWRSRNIQFSAHRNTSVPLVQQQNDQNSQSVSSHMTSTCVWMTTCDVMSLPALNEINPSITETDRLHVFTQRQKEAHVEHLQNLKKEATCGGRFTEFVQFLMKELLKSLHLWMESGNVVVTGSVHITVDLGLTPDWVLDQYCGLCGTMLSICSGTSCTFLQWDEEGADDGELWLERENLWSEAVRRWTRDRHHTQQRGYSLLCCHGNGTKRACWDQVFVSSSRPLSQMITCRRFLCRKHIRGQTQVFNNLIPSVSPAQVLSLDHCWGMCRDRLSPQKERRPFCFFKRWRYFSLSLFQRSRCWLCVRKLLCISFPPQPPAENRSNHSRLCVNMYLTNVTQFKQLFVKMQRRFSSNVTGVKQQQPFQSEC